MHCQELITVSFCRLSSQAQHLCIYWFAQLDEVLQLSRLRLHQLRLESLVPTEDLGFSSKSMELILWFIDMSRLGDNRHSDQQSSTQFQRSLQRFRLDLSPCTRTFYQVFSNLFLR